jgi:hypothetical protein
LVDFYSLGDYCYALGINLKNKARAINYRLDINYDQIKKGGKRMKKLIVIIAFSFLIIGIACNGTKTEQGQEKEKALTFLDLLETYKQMNISLSGIGRYQISQHSQFIKNTFLLDTVEGKVWILTENPETKRLLWQKVDVER